MNLGIFFWKEDNNDDNNYYNDNRRQPQQRRNNQSSSSSSSPAQFSEPNRQSERDLRRMSRRMQPIWRVLDRSHILQFICTTDDVETDIENESGSKKEKKVVHLVVEFKED